MNLREIKEMINLMNEHNLSEIEVAKGDLRVKLKKASASGPEVIVERIQPAPSAPPLPPEQAPTRLEAETKKLIEIKAPIVGTFYQAPSPDAAPFVEVGQEIEVGQVVCIIEAMKLMNEIKSEVKGKIVDILTENADPVEYGQILFLIEPT